MHVAIVAACSDSPPQCSTFSSIIILATVYGADLWSVFYIFRIRIHTAIDDLNEITDYLLNLGQTDIYNLGLALGLNQPHVKKMKDSETFRDDVIAAWLQKEDQVTRRGVPIWESLVKALRDRRVNQTGLAKTIESERCN